jgi:hypothetical protein
MGQGIAEILASGKAPGLIISNGRTDQRKIEDQRAKDLLKGCRNLEIEHGTNFMRGSGVSESTVKHTWESELRDDRKTSITERYDDRMERTQEIEAKLCGS